MPIEQNTIGSLAIYTIAGWVSLSIDFFYSLALTTTRTRSVTQVRCEVSVSAGGEGSEATITIRNATIVILNDTSHVPKHIHNPDAGKTAN